MTTGALPSHGSASSRPGIATVATSVPTSSGASPNPNPNSASATAVTTSPSTITSPRLATSPHSSPLPPTTTTSGSTLTSSPKPKPNSNSAPSPRPPASAKRSTASAQSAQFNPNWIHYFSAAVLAGILLGGFLRWGLMDWADPQRCETYLKGGRWLDAGKGNRNWQPDGCIHSPPDAKLLQKCFAPSPLSHSIPSLSSPSSSSSSRSNRLLFIGDSVTRQIFFASTKLADPTLPGTAEAAGGEKHSDRRIVIDYPQSTATGGNAVEGDGGQVEFEFWWDPYLNSTRTIDRISRTSSNPDGLLILGSGLWYLRHQASGGIAAWTHMIDNVFDHITASQPVESSRPLNRPPPYLTPQSSGLAEAIVYLPVVHPIDSLLADHRKSISHTDVEAMNADLAARLLQPSRPPLKIPTVFNDLLSETETTDGLHYSEKVIQKQVEILFGWRCNDIASEMNGACCRSYRRVRPAQWFTLLFICGWAPLGMLLKRSNSVSNNVKAYFPNERISLSLSIFGFGIFYMFLADRTTILLKEQKEFNGWFLSVLMIAGLVAGLATMVKRDKDMGFLNREQTDEWKGWMQIAILIYHWFGASKVSGIYNAIRVLVASYLFMTGYGHFTYYYKKKEFGFQRIAMVMVRLNLLSVVLPYTMNTDYAFYYFAPLVSWWYTIIFFTMYAGHQFNDKPVFMLGKIVLSAVGVALLMHHTWILQHIFDFLHAIFGIRWSAREWGFRVSLDLYIVYGGMLCAYLFIKINEYRLTQRSWWPVARNTAICISAIAMFWYFWFELSLENKFVYNGYHAVVSFVPIFAFIVLRNATPVLRSCSSRLFMFVGQCSLETFIIQFHVWLASDTRAVLMVIPYVSWRPINLLCSTIAFVWLSYKVSIATGDITEWAVGKPKKQQHLPMPTTTPTAVVAAVVETDDGKETVPESIPLMNRGEVANEGEDEDMLGTKARGRSSQTKNPISRFSSTVFGMAKESTGVRLGLVLLVLWVMNILY